MSKEKKVTEADTSALSIEQLEREMNRLKHQRNYRRTLTSTISVLITVAALTILISMLVMPVLQIVGESMTPSITNGEIVVALKGSGFEKGEIIAFYYNNKILVKRVIASAGDWGNIDENGNVFINGTPLNEPYLVEKAYGDTNIELPYQVPDGKIFVMGDHRATSADSRNTAVGCVSDEQIVGKVLFRIWPFDKIGMIH